jgi:hypothetical protein
LIDFFVDDCYGPNTIPYMGQAFSEPENTDTNGTRVTGQIAASDADTPKQAVCEDNCGLRYEIASCVDGAPPPLRLRAHRLGRLRPARERRRSPPFAHW